MPVVERARRAIDWPARRVEWPTIAPVRPKRAIRPVRPIPTIAERLPAALRLAAPTRQAEPTGVTDLATPRWTALALP